MVTERINQYEKPQIKVVLFETKDVITTSGFDGEVDDFNAPEA